MKELMFEIKKDIYINKWIVWEVHKNYQIDRFHAKTKKECKEWLKK